MKKPGAVYGVILVTMVIIVAALSMYVWALSFVRSDVDLEDEFELDCRMTHEGDFLVYVTEDDGGAGAGTADIILKDEHGEVVFTGGVSYAYGRDPHFEQVKVTFIDEDHSGRVNTGDYFYLPSIENGGVAELGGEFMLIWEDQIMGNCTFTINPTDWTCEILWSTWNFKCIDENVTMDQSQSPSTHLFIPWDHIQIFQLDFLWSNNDTVVANFLIEDIVFDSNIVHATENSSFHTSWEYRIDHYQYGKIIGDYEVPCELQYSIQIHSKDTNETILSTWLECEHVWLSEDGS